MRLKIDELNKGAIFIYLNLQQYYCGRQIRIFTII